MDPDRLERENFNRLRKEHDRATHGPALHVAIPDLADPCYLRLTEGICRAAEGHGAAIRLTVTRGDRDREAEAAAVCEVSDGIGLVLVSAGDVPDHILQRCRVVGVGPLLPKAGLSVIATGRDQAIRAAVEHLSALGHSAIRFVHTGLAYSRDESRRFFLRAAAEVGAADRVDFVDLSEDGARQSTIDALAQGVVTAALVSDDTAALDLVDQLRQSGVRVPLDVSVSGFGMCAGAMPGSGLTTVDTRDDAIANVVVEALCRGRQLETGDFTPRLVVSATTGYVARGAVGLGA